MKARTIKVITAAALVVALVGGAVIVLRAINEARRHHVVAYFDNSNGIFVGDNVNILGIPVGKIDKIEPERDQVKVSFSYDAKYDVPADAKAVILSPSLVTIRALQLTPVFNGGPVMGDNAVIPRDRTAVPVEFDDLRQQLEKLVDTLQPTQPGGVSTLGSVVTTLADNLRGQGGAIREAVIKLSQAVSALGDHSGDLFGTIKSLSALVSALRDSDGVLKQLNQNLATITGTLANDPNEVGDALSDLNDVVGDLTSFVSENRESLGTTSDKLASVTTAVTESLDDLEQTLHLAPTAFQNFLNIYQPAQGTLTGYLAANNLANPLQFICGAVQAASRMGAEESARRCVQYLAPIVKNRQINYFPLGINPFVGATARPNEVTYSEDWMRPDYIPPPPSGSPEEQEAGAIAPPPNGPLPPPNEIFNYFGEPANPYHGQPPFVPARPENPLPTNPADGLQGLMLPPGA
jgi:phospholipid/cholesterol/gamma-HCH transport system substrate-binding protein